MSNVIGTVSLEIDKSHLLYNYNIISKQVWQDSLPPKPEDFRPSKDKAPEEIRKELFKSIEPYIVEGSPIHKAISSGIIDLPFTPILGKYEPIRVTIVKLNMYV